MGQNRYIDESLHSFLEKLASHSPEPAGGAALALAGASAAALLSLACHTTTGAATDEDEVRLASCRADAERLSHAFQELIEADTDAYREVTRALRAPRVTDREIGERNRRLDEALASATEVPLRAAATGLEVLALSGRTVDLVEGPVVGDVAAAAHLAEAAVAGSLRNAHINAAAISDREYARQTEERVARIRAEAAAATESLSSLLAARGLGA